MNNQLNGYQAQHTREHAGYDQPPAYVQPAAGARGAAGVLMVEQPQPPQGVVLVQSTQSYSMQEIHAHQAKEHAGYDQPTAAGVTVNVVTQPQQPVMIPVPPQDTSHVDDYLIANIFACFLCPGCLWILGIIGIVKSINTRSAKECGNIAAAETQSKLANNFWIATVTFGSIGWVIFVIVLIFFTPGTN